MAVKGTPTWISIDYDDVSVNKIEEEIKELWPGAEYTIYETSPGRHLAQVYAAEPLEISLKKIAQTSCDKDYIAMVTQKKAFYFRISPRFTKESDGTMKVATRPRILKVSVTSNEKSDTSK